MHKDKTIKPILNKFHFPAHSYLIILILVLLTKICLMPVCGETSEDAVNVVIIPQNPQVGDTVVVKIAKDKSKKSLPKVFFETNKQPVFELSKEWYRSFIPLSASYKPGDYKVEVFYKGKEKKIDLIVSETKYPLEELTLPKTVVGLMASRIERVEVNRALSVYSPEKLWSGKFLYPSVGHQSTPYGVKRRVNGVIDPDYFHKGLDFAVSQGSNVISPENSKVVLAGQESKGFVVNGNCIFLDHGHGVVTGYLHLSKLLVKEGDIVKKGQIIGKVGSTGIASGPHLHWGVYVSGKTVDPIKWTSMIIE